MHGKYLVIATQALETLFHRISIYLLPGPQSSTIQQQRDLQYWSNEAENELLVNEDQNGEDEGNHIEADELNYTFSCFSEEGSNEDQFISFFSFISIS